MPTASRRIDHLVLAVQDLEAAADFYRRLGFQVGARNRHPWGTENRVIQFASSFLELITVADVHRIPPHAPRSFSFGRFVRDYLSGREGLAMFVLDSADAPGDAAAFARAGIGDYAPFSFERSGRTADGIETHVAFTLAFATDDRLPDAAFFVCQQHHPEAFWSSLLQRHENGATNVTGVTLEVKHPEDHLDFLRAFTGVAPSGDHPRFRLTCDGCVQVERLSTANGLAGFTGFSLGVPDLGAIQQRLAVERVPFRPGRQSIVIPSGKAFGARIEFVSVGQ